MREMEHTRPVVRRQEPTVARTEDDVASGDEESDVEFEFPFVSQESGAGAGAAAADELFADGRIRASYPVFGRVLDEAAAPAPRAPLGRLFQLERARTSSVASTSSSSSTAADASVDGASPDSYCLWTPGSSPASSPSRPPRKSGSTGSVARWRRIGELVVGRSHSDGKERFLFLSAPPSPARDRDHSPASKAKQPSSRMSYGGGAKASTGGRRTFLPYRQDLVGLFASAHGLSRSTLPF
uniref:DUF1645 family protein n=1 Tax=Zea mays TaxID=4577 RepID=B6SQ58_MAIZE|nr:hypothetical protein [Zea mays]